MRSVAQPGLGIVVPHDMALDRELWRWTPDGVALYLTRTRRCDGGVTSATMATISEPNRVAAATADLLTTEAAAYLYACTSGSFVRGVSGERALVAAMVAAGAPAAVTTSGALLKALAHLDVTRIAIATPYDDSLTEALSEFLVQAGVSLVSSAHLGHHDEIWKVGPETTAELVRRADLADAEAVFVSCTNLATYDLVATLEAELGKPVLTANQVTMWAGLRLLGRPAVGPGQRLLAA